MPASTRIMYWLCCLLSDLKGIELYYPKKKSEQEQIAIQLSNMDNEIEELKSKFTKYQNLKQGMMQNLLTGKIRLI